MPFASPYSYAANNPVVLVDVDGLAPGGDDKKKGDYEGQTTSSTKTVTRATPNFGRHETVDIPINLVWHGGTEKNDYSDSGWREKGEYQRTIFSLVVSNFGPVITRDPYGGPVYKEYPKATDLGLKPGKMGVAFFEAHNASIEALSSRPPQYTEGLTDASFDVLLALDGAWAISKLGGKALQGLARLTLASGREITSFGSLTGRSALEATPRNGIELVSKLPDREIANLTKQFGREFGQSFDWFRGKYFVHIGTEVDMLKGGQILISKAFGRKALLHSHVATGEMRGLVRIGPSVQDINNLRDAMHTGNVSSRIIHVFDEGYLNLNFNVFSKEAGKGFKYNAKLQLF